MPREADHLVIADDPEGAQAWKTAAEEALARADAERARADALEREVQRLRDRGR